MSCPPILREMKQPPVLTWNLDRSQEGFIDADVADFLSIIGVDFD